MEGSFDIGDIAQLPLEERLEKLERMEALVARFMREMEATEASRGHLEVWEVPKLQAKDATALYDALKALEEGT